MPLTTLSLDGSLLFQGALRRVNLPHLSRLDLAEYRSQGLRGLEANEAVVVANLEEIGAQLIVMHVDEGSLPLVLLAAKALVHLDTLAVRTVFNSLAFVFPREGAITFASNPLPIRHLYFEAPMHVHKTATKFMDMARPRRDQNYLQRRCWVASTGSASSAWPTADPAALRRFDASHAAESGAGCSQTCR